MIKALEVEPEWVSKLKNLLICAFDKGYSLQRKYNVRNIPKYEVLNHILYKEDENFDFYYGDDDMNYPYFYLDFVDCNNYSIVEAKAKELMDRYIDYDKNIDRMNYMENRLWSYWKNDFLLKQFIEFLKEKNCWIRNKYFRFKVEFRAPYYHFIVKCYYLRPFFVSPDKRIQILRDEYFKSLLECLNDPERVTNIEREVTNIIAFLDIALKMMDVFDEIVGRLNDVFGEWKESYLQKFEEYLKTNKHAIEKELKDVWVWQTSVLKFSF